MLVHDVANDCVTDGGETCCWVGFVVASELFLLYICRYECKSAFAIEIFVTLVEIGLGGVG